MRRTGANNAGLDLGGGAFRYHLDPLWAAPAIDAVGIDAYLPLADWRDGDIGNGNPDGFAHAEDDAAMRAMVAAARDTTGIMPAMRPDGAHPHTDHGRAGGQALGLSGQGHRKLVGKPALTTGRLPAKARCRPPGCPA